MKKILMVCFLIIVTIACVALGINTRYKNRIEIMQLPGEGNGYIIETETNNIIIIDGGTKNDAINIKKIIKDKGNPTIIGWYLTSVMPENSGALCEIINNSEDIIISNIFTSVVTDLGWYANCGIEQETIDEIEKTINTIMYGKYKDIVTEMGRNVEYQMENFYVKALEVKEETTYNKLQDQNIVLKLTNRFKNVIFLGNITEARANFFLTSNVSEIQNINLIQIAGTNIPNQIIDLIYNIKPEILLYSNNENNVFQNFENVFTKQENNKVVEIW